MLIIDVNVLVAMYRTDHPHAAPVRAWFDGLQDTVERFAVPAIAWGSFVRLVTSRRVFPVPAPRSEAFAFVESLRAQPSHLPVEPGSRHLELVRRLCDEADAGGDLVPDAILAAIALEHGGEIVSLDRDFARFTSVPHRTPLLG